MPHSADDRPVDACRTSIFIAGVQALDHSGSFAGPVDVSVVDGRVAEITLLHRAGLSIEAALLAATASGAELCGVGDRLGRIAPGYEFDAVLLDEDPADPAIFTRPGCVTGVFQRGVPVVPHSRLADLAASGSGG